MKHKCIVVLGMHRSGTSCLAGNLQQAGLRLGRVSLSNKFNLRGNRENKEIVQLHNSILKHNGGKWDDPPADISWDRNHKQIRNRIIIRHSLGYYKYWGFKDSRALLLLEFWKEKINDIQPVGTFRHPLSVALSLNVRNNIPMEKGFYLWAYYNRILLDRLKQSEFPLISFDLVYEEYLLSLNRIIRETGLNLNKFNKTIPFYDSALVHHMNRLEEKAEVPRQVMKIYKDLDLIFKNQLRKKY